MVGYCREHSKRFFNKKVIRCVLSVAFFALLTLSGVSSKVYATPSPTSSKCLIEVTTGRVLYSENMNVRLPMASTTKAMTALLAAESGKMQETVTVPKCCAGIEGSSIYLQEGDKLTLEALTYGLMLRSGNDAAETIALYLGGSLEGFADMMNAKASALGLKNTHFVNPHGLHDDNHYTSAYDLAMITAEGMKNETFQKIVSTKSISFDQNGKKWQFVNKNKLLFQYEGCTGVKTGYTKKAGRCLIASSERDGMQLISVVLNVPPMFEECSRLMNLGYDQYEMKKIVGAGEIAAGVPISGVPYRKAELTVDKDLIYPLKKDGSEQPEIKITALTEIPKGFDAHTDAGNIEITLDNRLLFSENLFIMK